MVKLTSICEGRVSVENVVSCTFLFFFYSQNSKEVLFINRYSLIYSLIYIISFCIKKVSIKRSVS